jgi:plasmid maintenance system antidote protein VapI
MRKMTMSQVLLREIEKSGHSLYQISLATGLDKSALGRFVAGRTSIRLDLADKLAAYLGLELHAKETVKYGIHRQ